jgi:hypothetical protein
MVVEFCTCGAKVPEDARFCHKCGRPLYDMPEPELQQPVQSPILPPEIVAAPAKPLGVGFRNPGAVRTGMIVAGLVCLLQSVPMPSVVQPIWLLVLLLAGGFLSVYMYHRRTGHEVSVMAGARLGWMTGVFVFLVMLILLTVSVVAMGLQPFFNAALAIRGTPELAEQVEQMVKNPTGLAAMLFMSLLAFFFILTMISSAGGALAAKVLEKD